MRAGAIAPGLPALLVAAGLALAGCGALLGNGVPGSLMASSCENMGGGACQEQVDRIAARHPGATEVDIRCTVAVCDRKGGSGTAVVTLPDGTTVNDTFTYVGDPAPLPVPSCAGLPPDICGSLARDQADGVAPSKRIVAITVTCTAAGGCTAAKGEADVKVTLADGSTSEGGTAWEGGTP